MTKPGEERIAMVDYLQAGLTREAMKICGQLGITDEQGFNGVRCELAIKAAREEAKPFMDAIVRIHAVAIPTITLMPDGGVKAYMPPDIQMVIDRYMSLIDGVYQRHGMKRNKAAEPEG